MEHDIFATPTNPDTLEPGIVQAGHDKDKRNFKRSKKAAVIAVGMLAIGLFVGSIEFIWPQAHYEIDFLWYSAAIGIMLSLAAAGILLCVLVYFLETVRKLRRLRQRFGIDDLTVRNFEHERASGRSKLFGVVSRRRGYCILTENWLYGAHLGVLLPLREIVSSYSFRMREQGYYIRFSFNNGRDLNLSMENKEDILSLQQTLAQLLPNTKHTRKQMLSTFSTRFTIEEITMEENPHGL